MKTKLWIPCILLGFGLSSFLGVKQDRIEEENMIALQDQCTIYGVVSLSRNGQEISTDISNRYYFCSGNMFMIYSHTGTGEGTWVDNGKTIMISTSVPDASLNWINGAWNVLERSEWTLELERTDGTDTWRVLFEGRQR